MRTRFVLFCYFAEFPQMLKQIKFFHGMPPNVLLADLAQTLFELIPVRFRASLSRFPQYEKQCWYMLMMALAYLQLITLESNRLKSDISQLDSAVVYCEELVSPQVERPELRSLPRAYPTLFNEESLKV